MPELDPINTHRCVVRVFEAVGVPGPDADLVSRELISAEMFGVASHGLLRVMEYLDDIASGRAVPGSEVSVTRRRGGMIVDGGWNLGIVTAHVALRAGIERAKEVGVSAVVTHRCNHVNRLGSYVDAAARAGLVCLATAAVSRIGHSVVPWGGAEGRLGTNPFAYGFPTLRDPIVADFATSVIPEGKVRLAYANGQPLPEGAVLDSSGKPTRDASAFYTVPGGNLLPFGGSVGYKGYALGLLVELLSGVLAGTRVDDIDRQINGLFIVMIDPLDFLPADECELLAQGVVDYMHSSKPAPGYERVYVPGEIEQLAGSRRTLYVDDGVWNRLQEAARSHDVDLTTATL